ncbi:hypothetical protein LX32DRAFT_376607 [Colletotrichum zoysiae]|uniref:Uncharacterized protein n=1 Tax=Colletotrichum zoysiae TaxID=1216348 RepID=A0AAD9M204_9PEZI|nr:hypothetical protein LX32DRAFT_376607 [Colletotrichum zoysiae]
MLSWTASLPKPRSIPVCRRLDHFPCGTRWAGREPIQIEITIRHRRRGEGLTMRPEHLAKAIHARIHATARRPPQKWGVQSPDPTTPLRRRTLHIGTSAGTSASKQASKQCRPLRLQNVVRSSRVAHVPLVPPTSRGAREEARRDAPTRPRAPTRRVFGCVFFSSSFFFFFSFLPLMPPPPPLRLRLISLSTPCLGLTRFW